MADRRITAEEVTYVINHIALYVDEHNCCFDYFDGELIVEVIRNSRKEPDGSLRVDVELDPNEEVWYEQSNPGT